MATEYFDILDCRGIKTGEIISRDEAHSSGVWHGAFHCLIIREFEGRRTVLFQKRSYAKKIAPGKFDVSVGGHYTIGEDATIAGPREIMEELGINIKFSDLAPIGRRIFVYCFTAGVKEYEFQDVFLLSRDVLPGQFVLQQDELDGMIELDLDEGIALFSGKKPFIIAKFQHPDGRLDQLTVTTEDFVPCVDEYYLKLLVITRRYFDGDRDFLRI